VGSSAARSTARQSRARRIFTDVVRTLRDHTNVEERGLFAGLDSECELNRVVKGLLREHTAT